MPGEVTSADTGNFKKAEPGFNATSCRSLGVGRQAGQECLPGVDNFLASVTFEKSTPEGHSLLSPRISHVILQIKTRQLILTKSSTEGHPALRTYQCSERTRNSDRHACYCLARGGQFSTGWSKVQMVMLAFRLVDEGLFHLARKDVVLEDDEVRIGTDVDSNRLHHFPIRVI